MPIPPLLLTPAYRADGLTPWGGKKLSDLFYKPIPDEHTGESLEMSVIPGFESKHGEDPLSGLILKYGKALIGTAVTEPFPLLLKLIDAHDKLSVQVHPWDAYAWAQRRKLGKSEAWVVIASDPGAELILGFNEGVTLDMVTDHIKRGSAIETLLRKVPVRPGETYYIPAGTVHAIGEGIVLYEIQQSSDLTYRLYDWERRDSKGKKRELHIRESLDVIDIQSRPAEAKPVSLPVIGEGVFECLLDNRNFRLRRLKSCRELQLEPDPQFFSVITVLEYGLLEWNSEQLELQKGQTALLPADGFSLRFTGELALLAKPGKPS